MAFTIQDLINQKIFSDVKLVAGRRGSSNEIFWINIMEILDSPKSVQVGELLFTTGYGLQNEAAHKDLIAQLSKRGVTGIAIQVGYYIDVIPSYIIEQANQLDFPILLLPKSLTFSEILRTMTRVIDSEAQKNWSRGILKEATAFFEKSVTEQETALFSFCENEDTCTYVMLLDPVNYVNAEEERWRKCLSQISSFVQSYSQLFLLHELPQHKYILLTTFPSSEEFRSMLYSLNTKLTLLSEQLGTNYHMGTDRLRSRDGFVLALKHATDALNTLQLIRARRGVCAYSQSSFVKMLGQMHHNETSVVLDNQPLQMLLNYDRLNNSNYTHTLRVYLSNSCNMTKTARQLFLHRHTLIKRLEKISVVGNLDLEDYYTRLYMSITMLFHDYFVY